MILSEDLSAQFDKTPELKGNWFSMMRIADHTRDDTRHTAGRLTAL